MKQLEISIRGRLPAMIESKLPLKVGYETLPEKENACWANFYLA